METKEVKIQTPEGYEIDKENSTFECIKFKPIKKDITYEDVCNKLFKGLNGYFITSCGHTDTFYYESDKFASNSATNNKQLEKLLALNKLLNIAEYYNKQHSIGISTIIMYDKVNKVYSVTSASTMYVCGIKAIFNRKEDAQAVIDNPNFREILDIIYK